MFENKNYNIVPYTGVVLTVAAMVWFAFVKVDVGFTYTMLFLVPIALLFTLFIFIDESTKKSILRKLKIPFTTSPVGGAALLLAGWVVYVILNFVGKLFSTAFSITSFMIPLAAEKTIVALSATSQQLSIVADTGMRLFTSVFVASFIEEFNFRFVIIFIAYVLSIFIVQAITAKKPSHQTALILSFVITGLAFAGIHRLNESYVSLTMYIVATIFSLLMCASIYYAGAFLSFTIGFHQANNFFWFVEEYGWSATTEALISVPGFIMIAYWVVMIIIVLNNIKPTHKFFVQIAKDLKKKVALGR